MDTALGPAPRDDRDRSLRHHSCPAADSGLCPNSQLAQPSKGPEHLAALGVIRRMLHGLLTLVGIRAVLWATLPDGLSAP
eukprot:5176480-Alexandrium_andersonii.AAC.1